MEAQSKPDDNCLGIALPRYGLITHAEAIQTGKTQSGINRKIASGQWLRILPGVYALHTFPPTWEQRALAAQLWGGCQAVLCGNSAAYLHRMRDRQPATIEVAIPTSRTSKAPWLKIYNKRSIDLADRLTLGFFRITTPARTLVDLSASLPTKELEKVLDLCLRRRMVTIPRMLWTPTRLGTRGRRGSHVLEALVAERVGDKGQRESELEDDVARIIRRAKLKPPIPQYPIKGVGRVDFYWPDENVIVECDGFEYHQDREAFDKDRLRWDDLGDLGYRVIVVTHTMANKTPNAVATRIRRALRKGMSSRNKPETD